MISFAKSIMAYETALRAAFGDALVVDDLDRKHKKMRKSPFQFLRGTCWRWAEAAPMLCPDLFASPAVLSVGDAHAGNFGLWRDAQQRLVWGVNDYDEAALLPYPLDLVRLVTSVALASPDGSVRQIAQQALEGYRDGLRDPSPFILERDHLALRDAFTASDDERADFWDEIREAPPAPNVPPAYADALRAVLPAPDLAVKIAARSAGTGSLGRPRFVASGDYRGGPIAVEVKAVLPSCWATGATPGLAQRAAHGPARSPDPLLHYGATLSVRRLAPNSRKIEFDALDRQLREALVGAMARDLAAVHVADLPGAERIERDLAKRPGDWLAKAAKTVRTWTQAEYDAYRSR